MTDYFKLREELQALAAEASEDHDVEVMWYPMKDGCVHPQFENSRGGIAQDEGDWEFYAALRTAWPEIEAALFLAGCRVTRAEIKNPSLKRGVTISLNGSQIKIGPNCHWSFDLADAQKD